MPDAAKVIQTGGRFAVMIHLDEANGLLELPVGAGGSAAVLTDQMTVTHIIRRVILRQESWLHYVF